MSRLAGSRAGRWAAAVCAVLALGCVAGKELALPPGPLVACALCACVLALALFAARRRRAAAALLIVTCALGAVARGGVAAVSSATITHYIGTPSIAVDGVVRDASGTTVIIDATRIAGADTSGDVTGGVLVQGSTLPPLLPGDVVEVDGASLRTPSRRPGPESEATLEREDVVAVVTAPQVTLQQQGAVSVQRAIAWTHLQLVRAVDAMLPEPAAALLLGITFGIHEPLPHAVRAPLQDAGLVHIVVVSGLKVAMLLAMITTLGQAAGWRPRTTLLTALAVTGLYVLLSGSGPAALRSLLMAAPAMAARAHGRRIDPLPMLSLAAALMLGVSPGLVADPGFQLSFLGTAGILVLADPIARRLPGPRVLVEPFAVTVAAQAATVPVMAGTFGVLSLVGPVANALVLPVLPAIIVVGGAGALVATVAPWLVWLPLHAVGLLCNLIVVLAQVCAAIPGSAIAIGSWPPAWSIGEIAGLAVAASALVLLHQRHAKSGGTVAARNDDNRDARHVRSPWWLRPPLLAALAGVTAGAGTVMAASTPDARLHVVVLNVGSAPAALVESQGTVALIDGGNSPSALVNALGRSMSPLANHIDMVVLSGGDQTAVAGLAGLAGHYTVGTVLAPAMLTPGAAGVVDQLVADGATSLSIGNAQWAFGSTLWRCLAYHAQSTDRDDCVVSVASSSGIVLMLGVASTADQEEIAAMYPGAHADLLVSPPGGALSTALLAAVRPRDIAVPSAAGAPAVAVTRGLSVARTGADGDLRYDGGPGGLAAS